MFPIIVLLRSPGKDYPNGRCIYLGVVEKHLLKEEYTLSTVLIIGTLVPDKITSYCHNNGIKNSAADIAQTYILHGLEKNADIEAVDTLGAVRVKPYPKTKIKRFDNAEQKAAKGLMQGVGYSNLPVIGFWFREKALISHAKKWANKNCDKTDVTVLVYSMHSPFMKAAKAVKKIIPTAKIVLTVADLSLYMDTQGKIRKILKQIDWRQIRGLMKSVDKYLLYTKYMAEYLELPRKKWMVFEGLFDADRAVDTVQKKADKRICIYAGNLDARYGIKILIDAFAKIRNDAVLHIYGAGFDKDYIETLTRSAGNVEYKGIVTADEMFEIMKSAILLINPRSAALELTKYSCPSKTFEYMASGTPVLMTHLPGLPDEYEPYLYFPQTEDSDGFANAIDNILEKDSAELEAFGLRAARFIKTEKNSELVMKKVMDFVENREGCR